jgi:cytochrome P450
MVLYSVWGLHRRPDLWGNDADQFRPERWAERHPKNWDYLPFNGGPRICLGRKLIPYHTGSVLAPSS